MTNSPVPVFDGHNDVLLRLRLSDAKDPVGDFLDGRKDGHIDLPRAREGGLAGGLCAIYVPSPSMAKDQNGDFPTQAQPEALNQTIARMSPYMDQASNMTQMFSNGIMTQVANNNGGRHAAIVHRKDKQLDFMIIYFVMEPVFAGRDFP